ncbi:hypothetical protein FOA52_014598 [Chlamydomonas sp. UWO 241]|nr:hypothetical protein FOA52_014598 [Chlamydomonas sp. UWO 241]
MGEDAEVLQQVYVLAKQLADAVIPNEYGVGVQKKLNIASTICGELLGKLIMDMAAMREESMATQASPYGVASPRYTQQEQQEQAQQQAQQLVQKLAQQQQQQRSSSAPALSRLASSMARAVVEAAERVTDEVANAAKEIPNVTKEVAEALGLSEPTAAGNAAAAAPVGAPADSAEPADDSTSPFVADCGDADEDDVQARSGGEGEGEGKEEEPLVVGDPNTMYRLTPDANVNSPLRHVRTRLYFTSESHIHSLFNVLRFAHMHPAHAANGGSGSSGGNGGSRDPLLSDDGLQAFHSTTELDYLTHIVFRMYENKAVPVDAPERFRLEILFSPGAASDPFTAASQQPAQQSACHTHTMPAVSRKQVQAQAEAGGVTLAELEGMLKPMCRGKFSLTSSTYALNEMGMGQNTSNSSSRASMTTASADNGAVSDKPGAERPSSGGGSGGANSSGAPKHPGRPWGTQATQVLPLHARISRMGLGTQSSMPCPGEGQAYLGPSE